METGLSFIYSCVLGIGSALLGLVFGFMLVEPSSAVASVLIVIGAVFLCLAILIAHPYRCKRRRSMASDLRLDDAVTACWGFTV